MPDRILPTRRAPAVVEPERTPEPAVHVLPARGGRPPAGLTWQDVADRRRAFRNNAPYMCAACGQMILDYDWILGLYTCMGGCTIAPVRKPVPIAPNDPRDRCWWSKIDPRNRRIKTATAVVRCPFCETGGVERTEDGQYFCRQTRRTNGEWRVIGCGMIWREAKQQ